MRHLTSAVRTLVVAGLTLLESLVPTGRARAAGESAAPPSPHVTAGVGVGVVAGQLSQGPLPGFGFDLVIEGDTWGGMASYRGTGSDCGSRAESDGVASCRSVSIFDLGARYTAPFQSPLRPYADARLEYASGWRAAWGLESASSGQSLSRWAFGMRLGARYRARSFGAFAEAGPSFVRAVPDYVLPKILTGAPPMLGPDPNTWWGFTEVIAGVTFTFR